MFTPLELICCGLAEEEDIAQIGEESVEVYHLNLIYIVKLRRGSGKDRQGMAPKAKGLKA